LYYHTATTQQFKTANYPAECGNRAVKHTHHYVRVIIYHCKIRLR